MLHLNALELYGELKQLDKFLKEVEKTVLRQEESVVLSKGVKERLRPYCDINTPGSIDSIKQIRSYSKNSSHYYSSPASNDHLGAMSLIRVNLYCTYM